MQRRQMVGRLVGTSLPLYFAWEMLQMPAFTGTPHGRVVPTLMCVLATVLDVALVLALYGVGTLVRRPILVPAAAVPAISDRCPPGDRRRISIWEWVTVGWMSLWGYSAWHPTVAGVGVAAILQAIVMPPVVFVLMTRWTDIRRAPAEP